MTSFKVFYKDTWYLEDNGVRIFLAAGEEKALVIDTGMSGVDIHKAAKEVTDLPLIVRMLGFVKNQVSKNQGIENLVVLDMGYTSDDVE